MAEATELNQVRKRWDGLTLVVVVRGEDYGLTRRELRATSYPTKQPKP